MRPFKRTYTFINILRQNKTLRTSDHRCTNFYAGKKTGNSEYLLPAPYLTFFIIIELRV